MKKKVLLAAVFAAVVCVFSAHAEGDETLDYTVSAGSPVTVSAAATYRNMYLHADLVVDGATLSATGSVVTVGSESGENVHVTVRNGGILSTSGERTGWTIGGNGGFAHFTLEPNSSEVWSFSTPLSLSLSANAAVPGDTADILTLGRNTVFNSRGINNYNAKPVRILFNGGYLYKTSWSTTLFNAADKKFILESVGGNPIHIQFTHQQGNFQSGTTQIETRGGGDVLMNVWYDATQGYCFNLNSGGSRMTWNHTGNTRMTGGGLYYAKVADALPRGALTGNIMIEGSNTRIDLYGKKHQANGVIMTSTSEALMNSQPPGAVLRLGNYKADSVFTGKTVGNVWLEKFGTGTLTITNATVDALQIRTGTATAGGVSARMLETAGDTTLAVDKGTLAVTNIAYFYGKVNVANGKTLELGGSADAYLFATNAECVSGGTVVKKGAGKLTVLGPGAFASSDIQVKAGTLAFAAAGTTNKWFRWRIKQTYDISNLEINRLKIVGGDGATRVDGGGTQYAYSVVVNTTALKDMPEKSIMSSDSGWQIRESDYFRRPPYAIFDDETWTSLCLTNGWPQVGSSGTWRTLTFRLPASGGKACGYKINTGYNSMNGNVSTWTMETSPDGVNWHFADARENVIPPSASITWFNGDVAYPLLGAAGENEGLGGGISSNANVQVDAGATLDLNGAADEYSVISKLAVDWTAGAGMISKFLPAANGALYLTNVAAGQHISGQEVPITFGTVTGAGNVSSWSVYVNGVLKAGLKVICRDGKMCLVRSGLGIMIL